MKSKQIDPCIDQLKAILGDANNELTSKQRSKLKKDIGDLKRLQRETKLTQREVFAVVSRIAKDVFEILKSGQSEWVSGSPFLNHTKSFMNYPKAIRVARSLADISQGKLADRAEIDRSYLSLIESGKRQPSVETIEKIANALKIPFHLLTLLGSEEADVQKVSHEHIASLSLALTKLLLEVSNDEPKKEPSEGRPLRHTNHKSPRPRISSRRGPGNTALTRKELANWI
jgi:transcriptional regulator with XRE-family HTH domain